MIRDNLVSDFRGVEFRRIDFTMDGFATHDRDSGVLAFAIEGVASRKSVGEPFYIDNTAHPANRRLALARASKTEVEGFGLELSLLGKGNNGILPPSPGVPDPRSADRPTPPSTSPLLGLLLGQRVAIVAALAAWSCCAGSIWSIRRGRWRRWTRTWSCRRRAPPILFCCGDVVDHDDRHDAASAAPMILTLPPQTAAAVSGGQPYTPTVLFTLGYLLAWGASAWPQRLAQWALEQASLLSPWP